MSEVKTDSVVNVSGDNDSGIDLSTNDVVAIKTADTERVRVASDGKVGIGDTTPDDTLTIYGGTAKLRVGSTDSNHVRIGRNTTTGNFEMMRTTSGATDQVFFKAAEANNGAVIMQEGGGDVAVGLSGPTFSSGQGLHMADNYFLGLGSGNGTRPDFQIGTTGGATLDFRCGTGADTADLSLSTGGVFTGDFNDTSDERLKENIQDIAANQIDVVKQLRPVTFDWKATEKTSNTGFIAQEVALLLPNDVQRSDPDDSDSTLGINSMALVATLTAALQEAIAKIEALEARVTALEDA